MGPYRTLTASLCLLQLAGGQASAIEPLKLVRWVDSSTPIPGGDGTFFLDTLPPTYCELGVVFEGRELPSLPSGIYRARAPGQVEVLVDTSTPIPAGVGTFSEVQRPVCSGRRVLFKGFGGDVAHQGLYVWEDGELRLIASEATPSPHGDSHLTGFDRGDLESLTAVFGALDQLSAADAVLRHDGDLDLLVAAGDSVPGRPGASFESFGPPRLSEGIVTFGASYGFPNEGVFQWGGALSLVADLATQIPDQPGSTFSSVGAPAISRGRIVFAAGTPAGEGIYQHEGGVLATLIPPQSLSPEGAELFDYEQPQVDGHRLAFFAHPLPGFKTLYLSRGHGLETVLAFNDHLDGERVVSIQYTLASGVLVLHVLFEGVSQALYVAELRGATEVPTLGPAALSLLALALALASLRLLASPRRLGP